MSNNCQHFVRKILKDYYNTLYYSKLKEAYIEKKEYYATESKQAKNIEKHLQKYDSRIKDIRERKIPPHLTFDNIIRLYNILDLFRIHKDALSSPHKFTLLDTSLLENMDLLKCSLSDDYFNGFSIDRVLINCIDNTLGTLYNEIHTIGLNSIIAKYDAPIGEEDSIEEKIKKTIVGSLTEFFF